MNLKDCSVTITSNLGNGFRATCENEEILIQILELAGVEYKCNHEYSSDFMESLEDEGIVFKNKVIPKFYVKVVGGFGIRFVVTNISDLFEECFSNNIKIKI